MSDTWIEKKIAYAMGQTRNLVIGGIVKTDLLRYKHIPGAQAKMNRKLSRKAGFNETVDDERELSIRMKLARGQHFLDSPDSWFLLMRLDRERNKRLSCLRALFPILFTK